MRETGKVDSRWVGRGVVVVALVLAATTSLQAGEMSTFVISDSVADNHLVRDGDLSAHVLRFKGERSGLVFAFPAGNSGGYVEFDPVGSKVTSIRVDGLDKWKDGYSVRVTARFGGPNATVKEALVGSMREVRRFIHNGNLAVEQQIIDEFEEAMGALDPIKRRHLENDGIMPTQPRDSLNTPWRAAAGTAGKRLVAITRPEYLGDRDSVLSLGLAGSCKAMGGKTLKLSCPGQESMEVEITVSIPYAPLKPIRETELFSESSKKWLQSVRNRSTAVDAEVFALLERAANSLRFLAYEDKLLAGSFRFLTYFGRDTLLTARMLLPVAGPRVLKAAYESVLHRMSPDGQVAHEEDLGNQAILDHMVAFTRLVAQKREQEAGEEIRRFREPVMDYKMVDDNFLLAPLVRDILTSADGWPAGAAAKLLGGTDGKMLPRLATNLEFVLEMAASEKNDPHGVALNQGEKVGNWRDSIDGLGGGLYPGDVNSYLIQSALLAIGEIVTHEAYATSGLKKAVAAGDYALLYRAAEDPASLDALMRKWENIARGYRYVRPLPHTRSGLKKYLASLGPEAQAWFSGRKVSDNCTLGTFVAGRCYPPDLAEGVRFTALSLDAAGKPVPVMHSDPVFALFDGPMHADVLEDNLKALTFPFPLGLWTEVGPVVANPAYSDDEALWKKFGPGAYHGTVIWGWVQGMLELAVMKQRDYLEGSGGCAQACDELERIGRQLSDARKRIPAMATSELWTFRVRAGQLEPVAYGSGSSHATLANAVQLWSTVWLSVYYRLSGEAEAE
jgi:hypothetical protein